MVELVGYKNLTIVHEGNNFSFFRGYSETLKKSVLLKTHNSDFPSELETRFLEKDHTNSLNELYESVYRPIEFVTIDKKKIIVYDDNGSIPLKKHIQENNTLYLNPIRAIKLFLNITKSLGELHRNHIVHGCISPFNIFFNPNSDEIKLTGLGNATKYSIDNPISVVSSEIEDMIYYISPEQSGRINKQIDYRSDIYSLGIVFFESLTRMLPFRYSDPLSMIHSHIAEVPQQISALNQSVPESLSKIVDKMLAKDQADRYQSTYGLSHDLQICIDFFEKGQQNGMFLLGELDIPEILHIPDKIFGREKEVHLIKKSFDEVNSESLKIVLVSGPSGIGKSTIVGEAGKYFTSNACYFLSGTYKSFEQDIPYTGLTNALRHLIDKILGEPESKTSYWKKKILNAVEGQGGLLVNFIPELEVLIGPQPELPEVPPEEATHRLNATFFNFINVLTESDKKIVISLDDMHLSDKTSFDFIKKLIDNAETKNLLLILSYIDSYQESDNALGMLISDIKNRAVIVEPKPLTQDELGRLLCEILHTDTDKVSALVKLVQSKTNGVPIFVKEFINRAIKDGIIFFDYAKRSWRWLLDEIGKLPISDNVANLMLDKVQDFPDGVVNSLKYASCIGSSFDIETLCSLNGEIQSHNLNYLKQAIISGLITEASTHDFIEGNSINPMHLQKSGFSFYFVHDRIQEALYSLYNYDERKFIHFKIGLFLYEKHKDNGLEEYIYSIAHQLHLGFDFLKDEIHINDAIKIFYMAGQKAKKALSYPLAYTYFKNAKTLSNSKKWESSYAMTFNNSLELLKCSFLIDKEEDGNYLFDELLSKAKSKIDKARLYLIKSTIYMHMSKLERSFEFGKIGLKTLDQHLQKKPSRLKVLTEIVKTRIALGNKSYEEILSLPELTDPEIKIIITLYFRLLTYTVNHSQELHTIITLRILRLTLKYGIDDLSNTSFGLYGTILMLVFNKYEKGFKNLEISLEMGKKTGGTGAIGSGYHGLGYFGYFKISLEECRNHLETAFGYYKLAGRTFYASTTARIISNFLLIKGPPLDDSLLSILEYKNYSNNVKELDSLEYQEFCVFYIHTLTGSKYDIDIDPFQKIAQYPHFTELSITFYYVLMLQIAYFLGNYKLAAEIILKSEKAVRVSFFDYMPGEFRLFQSLTFAKWHIDAQLNPESLPSKIPVGFSIAKIKKSISQNIRFFRKRYNICPENYFIQYQISRSTQSILKGKFDQAIQLLESCLSTNKTVIGTRDLALIHDLLAEVYLLKSDQGNAHTNLELAFDAYSHWGAKAAALQLRNRNKNVLNTKEIELPGSFSGKGSNSRIDFNSIIKASQLLSGEIELSALLSNLMRILIENAGAEIGYLINLRDHKFLIEAESSTHKNDVEIHKGKEVLDNDEKIASSIIQYVSRTKKTVVLSNAKIDQKFSADIYLQNKSPKSIYCSPILNQGKLIAIIYLENNLTNEAFTLERMEVLKLLSSQAGISLENARLYKSMMKINAAYERFVPKQFLNLLGKSSIIDVNLGTQIQKEMTILFSDIRGFTSISENLNPQENFNFINDYLKQMEPVISKYHGFIDKYIGDSIMALFPTNADDAVSAALEMTQKLIEYNKVSDINIEIGIGLNTGDLMLGTVGGKERIDGTVISDEVNVASRIEGITKIFNTQILITENTYLKIKDKSIFGFRKLGKVQAKGKSETSTLYEVFDKKSVPRHGLPEEYILIFEKGLRSYYNREFSKAKKQLDKVNKVFPNDYATKLFLEKCSFYNENPVPENWNGVELQIHK